MVIHQDSLIQRKLNQFLQFINELLPIFLELSIRETRGEAGAGGARGRQPYLAHLGASAVHPVGHPDRSDPIHVVPGSEPAELLETYRLWDLAGTC